MVCPDRPQKESFSDAIAFVFRRLEAYPNGCATNSEELCVYLVNRSKQSVCVHFELRAENYYSSNEDVTKGERMQCVSP